MPGTGLSQHGMWAVMSIAPENLSPAAPTGQGQHPGTGLGGEMADEDTRPPISCYIRTLNEKRRIADVVAAALAVAREVVVVDSGSTDGTIALAEQAGARVIHQDWLGVGGQKRVGEAACTHDWLLDLDADEVVTPALADEITRLFAKHSDPVPVAFRLSLVTAPPFGRPWYGVDIMVRAKLYDRRRIRIPDSRAWDQFKIPAGGKVGRLTAPILHYSFTGVEHLMNKVNRNTTARAKEALKPLPLVILRIFLGFPFYFFKRYILRGLITKGVYGFVFAVTVAIGRWLRDVKMFEIHMRKRTGDDGAG